MHRLPGWLSLDLEKERAVENAGKIAKWVLLYDWVDILTEEDKKWGIKKKKGDVIVPEGQ